MEKSRQKAKDANMQREARRSSLEEVEEKAMAIVVTKKKIRGKG